MFYKYGNVKWSIVYLSYWKGKLHDERQLIAPLDSLLWDRWMIEAIFGFGYHWEIYTPEAKRKYGYYVLPLLFRDALIGRVVVNDRKEKRLIVKNVCPVKSCRNVRFVVILQILRLGTTVRIL